MRYQAPTILVAESDPDERLLLRRALGESQFDGNTRFVQSKEELYAYLHREGTYAPPAEAPFPAMLILDLHVIRQRVADLVVQLRHDPLTRRLPVVILTPPISEIECKRCYDAGANAVVEKPIGYDEYRNLVATVLGFWFEVVTLPSTI
ncbi:MAG TPA: response regulator [Rhodothermales bacterium]